MEQGRECPPALRQLGPYWVSDMGDKRCPETVHNIVWSLDALNCFLCYL